MVKGKIAFVVGHSNWGKSKTLRALTGDSHYIRRMTILGAEFWIRRMSNDDLTPEYAEFVGKLDPSLRGHVIAALCPQFDDPTIGTMAVLESLRARYEMFFWIIERQYGRAGRVTPVELQVLGRFGHVELFSGKAEAVGRAAAFKRFIRNVVLA